MMNERFHILASLPPSAEVLPASVDAAGAAKLMGFPNEESISILVREKCIRPLGHPNKNCCKRFSTRILLELASDEKFLGKCWDLIYAYHAERNRKYSLSKIKTNTRKAYE